MTISHRQLLLQMQKEIDAALTEQDDGHHQHVRERIAAVRAMADLVLTAEVQDVKATRQVSPQKQHSDDELALMQGATFRQNKQHPSFGEDEEEEANGDSIFDF
ncbi:YwdI family protein [Bacillaceae bacterium SIJ1]|uniref:YwdI family protein n=1 Tax=Litoribacterium kuwaitense TaxID=1398745 RepID=UPI0013EA24DF|nr:YwdI family protein [Litoribacterium kuwaitense]NGP44685.1 YwdI family protein [Litoribacterium kuwaitense]